MRNATAEERIAGRRSLVHVRVEPIAREVREALDVLERDLAFRGVEGIADRKLPEGFAERVHAGLQLAGAPHPPPGDRRHDIGRALHGGALHVVHHAADAAHLLAAAGAPRTSVHQVRQRRAVAGGLPGAVAVHDHDAAVIRRQSQYQLRRHGIVGAEDRAGQAPAPAPRERDGLFERVIGHERAHRTKGLDRVDRAGTARIAAVQEGGGHEGAAVGVGTHGLRLAAVAVHDLRLTLELAELLEDLASLAQGSHRAHAHVRQAWITDDDLTERGPQRVQDLRDAARGHDRLSDGGALLSGFHRHLTHHLAYEQLQLRRAGPGIGTQHRGVERIGLRGEAHRVGAHHRMLAKLERRGRRAGERHHVLAGEMLEQIPDAPADELHGAFRQDRRLHHPPEHALGEVAGL